jgi:hypothetical protein
MGLLNKVKNRDKGTPMARTPTQISKEPEQITSLV